MIINSTGILYWDMYFILKMLPVPGQLISVDIEKGTRDFLVVKNMEQLKHVFITEGPDLIEEIASTTKGSNFYNYLVRIGFGTVQPEQEGKRIIKFLEKEFKKHYK